MRPALVLLAASVTLSAQVQVPGSREPGTGKILVASRDLQDPNFVRTVVLLVHYDDQSVVGLILNRRTGIPLSRLFEKMTGKGAAEPIHTGGPVGRTGILALFRSRTKPDGADRVLPDVVLINDRKLLDKTLAGGVDSESFHAYLGYSGWTAQQLDNEIEAGAWFVFNGTSAMVFHPNPDELWPNLIRRTETGIAFLTRPLVRGAHESFQ